MGRVYGERFRPSLFVTATLDSYEPVRSDGTPVDPDRYDYVRAARDAIHFSRLVDRFVKNSAGSSAGTSSTSPPSNHSAGSRRTFTSPCS